MLDTFRRQAQTSVEETAALWVTCKKVSKLMFRLLDVAEEERLVGYVVSVVSLLGWFFHARYQRRLIVQEMQRISDERNQLQAR
jgi:hypothetical protein